jgi:hypothetical protein
LALIHAPKAIAENGMHYAKWSMLTAALSFQQADPVAFLRRLHCWWGEGVTPQFDSPPTSDVGWAALFEPTEDWFEARKNIFTEIVTHKQWARMGTAWEEKVAKACAFNAVDAMRLAKLFPKSFSDPFLFKAQRAIWQFTQPFIQFGQIVPVQIKGAANPMLLPLIADLEEIEFHPIAMSKAKEVGFTRDEQSERAIRAFLSTNEVLVNNSLPFHAYEWLATDIKCQTTDY